MARQPPDPNDRTVLAPEAVSITYVRHAVSLKRFIWRFFPNPVDVEDIAQEAFLRAFAVERSRRIEQPKSFLFRIAKHVALSQLRRKARQMTDFLEDLDVAVELSVSSAEEEFSGLQMLALHCEAAATLRPQCRQAYLLRKVHGLSHKEIAEQLGISVSTVEKHLMRGIEQCARYVEDRTQQPMEAKDSSQDRAEEGRR